MKKHIQIAILFVILLAFISNSYAAENQGTCGKNTTWVLDRYGLLTISGTGKIESSPWYKEQNRIERVVISEGVTSICESAFRSCTNLTSVDIAEGLKAIRGFAFYGCFGLTDINIPNSVDTIMSSAFNSCTSLKSIDLPESMYDIWSNTFKSCTSLENITIPNSIVSIGSYAFASCSSLSNIEIPNSVTRIGDMAFVGCRSLSRITIPPSVIDMGNIGLASASDDLVIKCHKDSAAYTYANDWDLQYELCHWNEYIEAIEPTCVATGTEAYWECTACGLLFNDKEGTDQISEPETRPATGQHTWNEPGYSWSEDSSSITATRACRNCELTETETVSTNRTLTKAPDDNEIGSYMVISNNFENTAFNAQKKEELVIPRLVDMDVLRLPLSLTTIETDGFNGIAAEAIIIPNNCITIEPESFVNCKNLLYVRIPTNIEIPPDAFIECPNAMIDQQ